MWRKNFAISISAVLVCAFQLVTAQNITDVVTDSPNCTHVVVTASIDPVSSTYTFNWVLSVDGGADISLAQVGLDGTGTVGVIDQSSTLTYFVQNNPSTLMPNNQPFVSTLTFMFDETANTSLVFRTVSTPLRISIPQPISKPRCQVIDPSMDVSCADNSENCFFCGNNVPAILTCPDTNDTIMAFCSDDAIFNFSNCPDRCGNQVAGIILVSIGGIFVIIAMIVLVFETKKQSSSARRNSSTSGIIYIALMIIGSGSILCGISIIVWNPCAGGNIGGGVVLILVGLPITATGLFRYWRLHKIIKTPQIKNKTYSETDAGHGNISTCQANNAETHPKRH